MSKEIYLDDNDKKILYALEEVDLPIMELSGEVGLAHKNVLQHLKKLEKEGFVFRSNPFGRTFIIKLNRKKFHSYMDKELSAKGLNMSGIFSKYMWDEYIYKQPNHKIILNEMPRSMKAELGILISLGSKNYNVIVELSEQRKKQIKEYLSNKK
jgi:DNA-binding Lrp family transcriptional regulator